MSEFIVDAFGICKRNEYLEGNISVDKLVRLAEESIDRAGTIRWSLQGGIHGSGHPQLTLQVQGSVQLMCQRCLTPFAYVMDSEAILVLAPDEQSADEIDAFLDDESLEVIVGSASMNVLELVEDEALLTLPLSPRHEECPSGLLQTDEPEMPKRESPFSVLKNIKQ